MFRLFKKIKTILIVLLITAFIACLYIMIDMGSMGDIISMYESLGSNVGKNVSKKIQFLESYTQVSGDLTLALNKGLSQDDIEDILDGGSILDPPDEPGGIDSWDSSNHNHYAIRQSNYGNIQLGKPTGNVSNNGCGLCSMIAAVSELSGVVYTPTEFMSTYPSVIEAGWFYSNTWNNGFHVNGIYALDDALTSSSEVDGTYKATSFISGSTEQILQMFIDNLDENKVAIVSADAGLFTNSGHIMCVTDLTKDGDNIYIHISDSSGRAANNIGRDWNEMSSLNIPIHDGSNFITSSYGKNYSFKWAIILERVE